MNIEKIINELTLEEKAEMCSGSNFWHTQPIPGFDIPGVMMCDGPHGLRKQIGKSDHMGINESIETVCYPTASALASSFDRDVLGKVGEALGDECQAENVAMILGPGVNIKRSPLCGRNFEYFSEDPYLSGELASSFVKSLQDKGVAACVKHFAVNNQETLRMSSDSVVDERTLHEIYLPAFESVVKKGKTRSVMCSYNAVNGTFLAENKTLLTDILREKWGFDGFVVTDWGAIQDRANGVLAGLDLEMPGGNPTAAKVLVTAVKNGKLNETDLDNAVRNVLRFVKESIEKRNPDTKIDRDCNNKLAADIETECAVLLKNENGILPLNKATEVAFIGEFAEKPRFQGSGSSYINVPNPVGALDITDGLNITYAKGYNINETKGDPNLVKQAMQTAKNAHAAVLFVGLPPSFETEGIDRKVLDMPENQNELIEAVTAVQPNTIVVLHLGSPVVTPWLDKVRAVLCMYLGGSNVGTATNKLLFGDVNPSGKLAESWPLRLEDTPAYLNFPGHEGVALYREGVYVGYRYYDKKRMNVLFPFGYGLSYTSFSYSDISLSKSSITDSDELTVTCSVKNTGETSGKEVLQLYVGNPQDGISRPIRELRGFEKVCLSPGQEKQVSFKLCKRAFSYYEPKINDWHAESGEYLIEIGSSSRDIRLSATVKLNAGTELPVVFTRNTPVAYLQKTAKGRAMMEQMQAIRKQSETGGSDAAEHLGEGSKEMVEVMMKEAPLKIMCSFGGIPDEQLDAMLEALNS